MTLDDLLEAGVSEQCALAVPGGRALNYASLRVAARSIGVALVERGVAAGDKVAAAFVNSPEIIAAFFGTAGARATFAPLNGAYTEEEFAFYLEDIAPALLLLAPGSVPSARAAAAKLQIRVADVTLDMRGIPIVDGGAIAQTHDRIACDDDVALFLHTSGTTSRPKGVPLTHANLTASAGNIARWYELGAADVSYCVMPLFHVHGLVFSTLAVLGAGGSVVVPEKFSAGAFWPTVAQYGVTVASAVPTILRTLLLRAESDGAPLPGEHPLRFIRSSSSPLPASEMQRLEARFGVPVIEAYSMTEAAHQMCANPLRGARRPGSVGIGAFVDVTILDADGNELEPGDVGEVCVRGANVTRGYHNNAAANAAAFTNGWFRTGDYGTRDADGYVTLVGRLKELINRGGEKISPVEVDDALMAHPGVKEAVSFAVPDEKYGEAVAAALVLHAGTAVDDVLAFARGRLAAFKIPTITHVVSEIPRTATGKVQRRIVAAAFAPAAPSSV
jgi:acyl-CoA synthetase (AMP-forming)/AMP-acid ligase II